MHICLYLFPRTIIDARMVQILDVCPIQKVRIEEVTEDRWEIGAKSKEKVGF